MTSDVINKVPIPRDVLKLEFLSLIQCRALDFWHCLVDKKVNKRAKWVHLFHAGQVRNDYKSNNHMSKVQQEEKNCGIFALWELIKHEDVGFNDIVHSPRRF